MHKWWDVQQFLKLLVGGIKYEGRPGILHQAVMMEHSVWSENTRSTRWLKKTTHYEYNEIASLLLQVSGFRKRSIGRG